MSKADIPKNKKGMTGKYWMKCHCGTQYEAKGADLGRGWGFSCSKACSARRRESGENKAEIIGKVTEPSRRFKSRPAPRSVTTEVLLVDVETGEVIGSERLKN